MFQSVALLGRNPFSILTRNAFLVHPPSAKKTLRAPDRSSRSCRPQRRSSGGITAGRAPPCRRRGLMPGCPRQSPPAMAPSTQCWCVLIVATASFFSGSVLFFYGRNIYLPEVRKTEGGGALPGSGQWVQPCADIQTSGSRRWNSTTLASTAQALLSHYSSTTQ